MNYFKTKTKEVQTYKRTKYSFILIKLYNVLLLSTVMFNLPLCCGQQNCLVGCDKYTPPSIRVAARTRTHPTS